MPETRAPEVGRSSDLWWIVGATVLAPVVATILTLWAQAWLENRKLVGRSQRVRAAIEREIEANLRTASDVWDRVGTRRSLPGPRLEAAKKLGRLELSVWEREAYGSLLPELPDAVSDSASMAHVAEHYALLRRMDWSHSQLQQRVDDEADLVGDQRLAVWAAYGEAYSLLIEIGNPLTEAPLAAPPEVP